MANSPGSNISPVLYVDSASKLSASLGRPISPGMSIQAIVKAIVAENQVILRAMGRDLLAETRAPLRQGEQLHLRVDATYPQVILKILRQPFVSTVEQLLARFPAPDSVAAQTALRALLAQFVQAGGAGLPGEPGGAEIDLSRFFFLPAAEQANAELLQRALLGFNRPVEASLWLWLQGAPNLAGSSFEDLAAALRQLLGAAAAGAPPGAESPLVRAAAEQLAQTLLSRPPGMPLEQFIRGLSGSLPGAANLPPAALEHVQQQLLAVLRGAGGEGAQLGRADLSRHLVSILENYLLSQPGGRAAEVLPRAEVPLPARMIQSIVTQAVFHATAGLAGAEATPGNRADSAAAAGLLRALAGGVRGLAPDAATPERVAAQIQALHGRAFAPETGARTGGQAGAFGRALVGQSLGGLVALAEPGLSWRGPALGMSDGAASLLARSLLAASPPAALSPAAQAGAALWHAPALAAAAEGAAPGSSPLGETLAELARQHQSLTQAVAQKANHAQIVQILQAATQALDELVGRQSALAPETRALRTALAQWSARYPAALAPALPGDAGAAPPLLRDALSELRMAAAMLGAFVAGPQAVAADPLLWRPAAESLDAVLRQLLRGPAPAPGGAPSASGLSTGAWEAMRATQGRLAQLLSQAAPNAPLQGGQAQSLGQTVTELLRGFAVDGARLPGAGDTLTPLRQLLEGVDGLRLQNAAALDASRPLHLMLPILIPGQAALAQIRLIRGGRRGDADYERAGFNLVLMVELTQVGLLKIEIHLHRKTLSAILTTARRAVKDCIDKLLDSFRERLIEAGYQVHTLTCLHDEELQALEPSGREGITYKKLNVQA